jgi:hypothetical protein
MNSTKGIFVSWGQQPFQLHGTNDDRGILAANGDALWPFARARRTTSLKCALAASIFHPG